MAGGVILYGPPACGKDTITKCLERIDHRYVHFRRLKAGPGRTAGYRMTTQSVIASLRAKGLLVWENERYGSAYAIDLPTLVRTLEVRRPIVHLGQAAAVSAVLRASPDAVWTKVNLWCPRDIAFQRLMSRGDLDVAARLSAWDETHALPQADISIDTAATTAHESAVRIHKLVTSK